MKRQVAILGPTPEFVRWSIRRACPLREDTDIASVDQTEKRLRAIRAAGLAIGQRRVIDGWAIMPTDDATKGFRLEEVLEMWGGEVPVKTMCGDCPANANRIPEIHGLLAGCHGWLPASERLIEQVEGYWSPKHQQLAASLGMMATSPRWYGIWSTGRLDGDRLELVASLLRQCDCGRELTDILAAFESCIEHQMVMDVDLLPQGHSDGLYWTLSSHCDQCKSTRQNDTGGCPVCGKHGAGHPPIKRRVLGLRPYVDLASLVGKDYAEEIVSRIEKGHPRPKT